MIVHGGVSNRINLKKINALTRNQCKIQKQKNKLKFYTYKFADVSLLVPPKSKTGAEQLTKDEKDEYAQLTGSQILLFHAFNMKYL